MPTSPLPNWAVSLAPPPEPIEAVVSLVVVPLSSPQAARNAAIAVELPPTARKRRRDTGSLSCFNSAIWRSPPGRLPAPHYGEPGPGGSKSPGGRGVRDSDQGRSAAGAGVDRLRPVR